MDTPTAPSDASKFETDLRAQLKEQIAAGPGDVLVGPEQFFSPVRDLLVDGFTVRRFLDLCGVIEACVLNERVITVAAPNQTERLMDESVFANDLILEPLFVGLSIQAPFELIMKQHERIRRRVAATSATLGNWIFPDDPEDVVRVAAGVALLESVFWEETLQIPFLPTPQQAPYFAQAQELAFRHWLYFRYAEARQKALAARLHHEYHSPSLAVPPIALRVLRRSETVEDLGASTLLERDRYARLRRIGRDLDELARDRSVAPATKRSRTAQYERFWNKEVEGAIGDDTAESMIGLPATTERLDGVAEALSGAADVAALGGPLLGAPFKAGAAVVKVAPRIVERFRAAPFRMLGTAIRKNLATSPEAIDREVRRLFGYEVTEADLDLARRLSAAIPQTLEAQARILPT